MSRCTSDLEFLQCDMCLTYFHKDIFCPHRRECKGANSQEMKKSEAEKLRIELDKQEDSRTSPDSSSSSSSKDKNSIHRSQLEQLSKAQDMKQRTQLANEWADEEDKALKEKLKKHSIDDALAFLDS